MNKNFKNCLNYLLYVYGVITFVMVIFIINVQVQKIIKRNYKDGYRAACQDFYNGKLKMECIINIKTGKAEWL